MIDVDLSGDKSISFQESKENKDEQEPPKEVTDAVSLFKDFVEYCTEKSMTLAFNEIKLRHDSSLPKILIPLYIALYKQGNRQESKLLK